MTRWNNLPYFILASTEIDSENDLCNPQEIPKMDRQCNLSKHLENRASLNEMVQRGLISVLDNIF